MIKLKKTIENKKDKKYPIPEEYEELFKCYYKEIYLNGEDEEMFQRDRLSSRDLI